MARGSFYNYFKTNEELLVAVASEINNELLRAIDPVIVSIDRIVPQRVISASYGVSDSRNDGCRSIAMQADPHALSWETLHRNRHIRRPLGVDSHPEPEPFGDSQERSPLRLADANHQS